MDEAQTTVRANTPTASAKRTPCLRGTVGSAKGRVWTLEERNWVIGKGPEADLRLADSGVSRRHAKVIRVQDGRVSLVDLGSTNGTFVDGERIEVAVLEHGARIGLGPDAELRFGFAEEEAPAPRAKPAEHPLTNRELDVARAVARGGTNREIAERLGVKAKTVSSHLDNIYGRLGLSSRVALTRWVLEMGLEDPTRT